MNEFVHEVWASLVEYVPDHNKTDAAMDFLRLVDANHLLSADEMAILVDSDHWLLEAHDEMSVGRDDFFDINPEDLEDGDEEYAYEDEYEDD